MQKLRQQQLFDRVFDKLPDHVTLLLIIISGFLLARLTWMMFPSDPSLIGAAPVEQESQTLQGGVSVIKAHAKSADLGQEIANYHLLGVYKPPAPQKVVQPKPVEVAKPKPEPKKPRPPMQLVGVYALSGKSGVAIINFKGKQEVVGLNEAIGDSGAKLVKVSAQSVDVSWDGDIATLQMPNIDKTALSAIQLPASQQPQPTAPQQPVLVQQASLRTQGQQQITAGARTAQQRPANNLNAGTTTGVGGAAAVTSSGGTSARGVQPQRPASGQNAVNRVNSAPATSGAGGSNAAPRLADFRQQIMNNNINLLKVIRPSPKKENGKLIGFRIRPGTNRALFQQTGLQSGDIVTQVNGMPLTSNAASMQAMQSLSSSSGATLTVLRGGQVTTVQVSF